MRQVPGRHGDDGRADPRLAAALAAYDGSPASRGEVLAGLAGARVFLGLVAQAVATEASTAVPGLRQESEASMALVSLVSASGARALPAFLDGAEVARWRAEVRPVPVEGPLACRTVLDDGAVALVLDPAGAAVAVSGAELVELAEGRVPVPGAGLSTRAGEVRLAAPATVPAGLVEALGSALQGEPVSGARLLEGPDGLVLGVTSGLTPVELAALAARVRERLGAALPAAGLDLAEVAAGGGGLAVPVGGRRWWRRGARG